MKLKVGKIISIVIIILTLFSVLPGCSEEGDQSRISLQESLEPFLKALEEDDLSGMKLTVYERNPDILVYARWSIDILTTPADGNSTKMRTIDTAILKEHIDLLRQIQPEHFEQVEGKVRIDAQRYFIFETKDATLTIAGYGEIETPYDFNGSNIRSTVFLNGYEVKMNHIVKDLFDLWPLYVRPVGLNMFIEGVPPIESISPESDVYLKYFTQVESATLYSDGTKQEIAPNDERLLRLLNFMAKSIDERSHDDMVGLVEDEEIERWYTYEPMLEINLIEGKPDAISDQKLLIFGNSFLAFKNVGCEFCEHTIAGRYWPYWGVLRASSHTGTIKNQMFAEKIGVTPWLDLLVYVGLAEQ